MKLSIIEHNPTALKGFLNNPKCNTGKLKSSYFLYSGIYMCEVNDLEDCIADTDGYGTCGDLALECPWRLKKDVMP